tara:strand:- start:413 stop:1147 length:735 start_codon:yes stop_codon:yes gene_type:complete
MATFVPKSTIMRLLQDIKEIIKNPLESQGIYYKHDDTDMLKGTAMIIGPKDTPYENGFYFFQMEFPTDYPNSPPKVKYLTNDGHTRFNPNFYRNGKVCLSILNTWKGDQWSACQGLSSVLLTLVSTFNELPLCNEPGFSESHRDVKPYNYIIKYQNFVVAILGMIDNRKYLPDIGNLYIETINELYKQNYSSIITKIKKEKQIQGKGEKEKYYISIYNMNCQPDYEFLFNKFTELTPDKLITKN